MFVKSTFFVVLASVITATSAIPVPQAAEVAPSEVPSPDPANLDPLPQSASADEFGIESAPTPSAVHLPISSHIPPKHNSPIHHMTSTIYHIPLHTPAYHWQPPVHHTTTLHHVPVHTPAHHEPPVHHTTTFHHAPVHTPIYHDVPVHHTTTFHQVPVHTPIYHGTPVHHTTILHHAPAYTSIHHEPPKHHTPSASHDIRFPVHTPVHHPPPVHHTTTPHYLAPVHTPAHVPAHVPTHHSFNRWGNYDSLKDFDNFYGIDNWDGYKFEQVFVKKDRELVCKAHEVHIVQQRLLVLQEMAKRIIVETICEVEVQTIVFEQWYASLHGFGRDLRRHPGHHQVAYDEEVVKHFPKFIKHEDGSLNLDDWHFTGKDLGKHSVIVKGHNWDNKSSPSSVWRAWSAARQGWYDLYGKWF